MNKLSKIVTTVGISFLIVLALVQFVRPGRVHHTSMVPTFNDSDIVLVDRLTYQLREPRHNEIVAVWDDLNKQVLIKRVIAVSGDNLKITTTGELTLNGERVEEPYLNSQEWECPFELEYTLPKDTIFVMGDNRNVSYDSRHEIGYLSTRNLMGRIFLNVTSLLNSKER